MPDNSPIIEAEIIRAAYADKVKETFMVMAENLSGGQGEKLSKERFLRSLDLVKKARDLALDAISEVAGEPQAPGIEGAAKRDETPAERLSVEDQAMIDAAVGGTTGVAKPALREPIRMR
jgi:hypothetical protein